RREPARRTGQIKERRPDKGAPGRVLRVRLPPGAAPLADQSLRRRSSDCPKRTAAMSNASSEIITASASKLKIAFPLLSSPPISAPSHYERARFLAVAGRRAAVLPTSQSGRSMGAGEAKLRKRLVVVCYCN